MNRRNVVTVLLTKYCKLYWWITGFQTLVTIFISPLNIMATAHTYSYHVLSYLI